MADEERTDDAAATGLRDAALDGARWVALARIGGEVLAFASAITLARLMGPAEFGRAAVALALVPLAAILTFEGCASALVQRPEVDRAAKDSAAFMSLALGTLLTLVTFAAAPLLAPVFGERTQHLVQLVSPVFLLAAPGCVPRAMLWRGLQFRWLSVVEICGLLAGALTSVGLAVAGANAEALVGGALAMTATTSVLLCARAPMGVPRLHRSEARGLAGFGIPAALAGLAHIGFANVDYVIVAARLNATAAGLYWRAFQLGVSYQEKISGILLRLAYPVYSRAGKVEEIRRLHARATRLHATVVLPLQAFVVVSAPVLVVWLFGPHWAGAVEPAQILALAGMAAAVLTGYPQVMLAVGKPKQLLRFNLAMVAVYSVVIVVAAGEGLIAACIAAVVAHALIFVGVYRFLLGPYLGVPMRRSLTDVAPALTGSAVVIATCLPLRAALESGGVPKTAILALVGLATGVLYLATIRLAFRTAWDDLWLLATRLVPRLDRAHRRVPVVATPGSV